MIAPGKQTREQVREALGTPSTRATFEKDEVWYYIGKRTETVAFLAPDVVEHQVLEVRFGEDGRVSQVRTVDATKAAKPRTVDRVTPTEGNELSILEQFIGNIGRFTPARDRHQAASTASSNSATILMILIIGLTAGPAVSL